MTAEEILKNSAAKNPFRTPEGYFEQFDERLMARLPRKPRRHSFLPRIWRYAAAIVIAAIVGGAMYWQSEQHDALADAEEQEEYMDEVLDYIVVDNMEIAEYLTEAY